MTCSASTPPKPARSGQTALKTAMEALGVEVDEERSFHNAMHDAYYTAQVLRKLPHPMDVLRYEEQPRKLCHKRTGAAASA